VSGACARTGLCCRILGLPVSPRALRENYETWLAGCQDQSWPDGFTVFQDVWLLFPMLTGRCVGKERIDDGADTPTWRYFYGPCRFLGVELDDHIPRATCGIHRHKPSMCRDYPHYDFRQTDNPGQMLGCGYNRDPRFGTTERQIRERLVPCDPDEC
jgi:Fe-S-cluster containining protein